MSQEQKRRERIRQIFQQGLPTLAGILTIGPDGISFDGKTGDNQNCPCVIHALNEYHQKRLLDPNITLGEATSQRVQLELVDEIETILQHTVNIKDEGYQMAMEGAVNAGYPMLAQAFGLLRHAAAKFLAIEEGVKQERASKETKPAEPEQPSEAANN